MSVPDLAIGSEVWPGVAKLIEECGELQQVLGKIIAYPNGDHPDGTDIKARLIEEIADAMAAATFVITENGLSEQAVMQRTAAKLVRFRTWHREEDERRAEGVLATKGKVPNE